MIRAFFRNAALLAAAEVLARIKGFAVIPLLTHRLGVTGYGVWAQVAVLVALLGPLIMLGSDSGVIRYLPGADATIRARSFVGWTLAVAASGLLVCIVVVLFRRPIAVAAFGTSDQYARFIPLAAVSIFATVVLNFGRTWFRLENDASRLAGTTVAQAVLSLVALLVWFFLDSGLYRLVLYTVLADIVLAVVVLAVVQHQAGWARPDFSIVPQLIRYGIVLLPAGYAIWALNWVDRIILVHLKDLRAVGLYSLAYSLGYLLIQVVVNPIWTMFPNAAALQWNTGRRDGAQRLFEATAGAIVGVSVLAIAGTAAFSEALLRLLAPAPFADAATVMPIVLAGYLLFMLAAFYETVFGLVDRQSLSAATVGVACLANVVLNLLLIPSYSYTGAAVATLIAFAVQFALCLLLNSRLRLLRTPWKDAGRTLISGAITFALLLPLRGYANDHPLPGLLGGSLLGCALFALLLFAVGVIKPGELRAEMSLVLRRRKFLGAGG